MSLRRRASQRPSGKSKPRYVVDVHQNRLVQVGKGSRTRQQDGEGSDAVEGPPQSAVTSKDDKGRGYNGRLGTSCYSKPETGTRCADPGNNNCRSPSQRKPHPPTPPPPPPLWTIPRPISEVLEESSPAVTAHPLIKARSLEELLTPPGDPRSHAAAAPRPKKASDFRKWVRWRTDVNQKLSSFMMDASDSKDMTMLPDNFPKPKSMKNETLNALLFHAYTDTTPVTSLDRLSYMIYGIPRIENKHRSRSMDELSQDDEQPNTTPNSQSPYGVAPVPNYSTYADTIERVQQDTAYGYTDPIHHNVRRSAQTGPPHLPLSPETRLRALTREDRYVTSVQAIGTEVYGYNRSITPVVGGAVSRAHADFPRPRASSAQRVPEPLHTVSPKAHRQYRQFRPSSTTPKPDSPSLEFDGHLYKPPVAGGVPTILSGLALRGHLPTPPRSEVTSQSTHAQGGQSLSPPPSVPPGRSKAPAGHLVNKGSHCIPRRH